MERWFDVANKDLQTGWRGMLPMTTAVVMDENRKKSTNPETQQHTVEGGTSPNFSTSRVTLIDTEELDNIPQRPPSPERAEATSEEEIHVLYGMQL